MLGSTATPGCLALRKSAHMARSVEDKGHDSFVPSFGRHRVYVRERFIRVFCGVLEPQQLSFGRSGRLPGRSHRGDRRRRGRRRRFVRLRRELLGRAARGGGRGRRRVGARVSSEAGGVHVVLRGGPHGRRRSSHFGRQRLHVRRSTLPKACESTFCAAEPKDPDAACNACITAETAVCSTIIQADCTADPDCVAFDKRVAESACLSKPQ